MASLYPNKAWVVKQAVIQAPETLMLALADRVEAMLMEKNRENRERDLYDQHPVWSVIGRAKKG